MLAFIPLSGSVFINEIADLTGVPERQLSLIVRMTASARFLRIDRSGQVAHTELSAPFVVNLALHDAVMFLADILIPTALQMGGAMRSKEPRSAYSLAFPTLQSFPAACADNARLRRQWTAYRHCAGHTDDGVVELLNQLNWRSLGDACIVDTCAHSLKTVMALSEKHPSLRFVVQTAGLCPDEAGFKRTDLEGLSGRITVQERAPAAQQVIKNAAVYLCRPAAPSSALLPSQLLAELKAHTNVLRANASATLVLVLPMRPDPSASNPDAEAKACLRELCVLQLTNHCELKLNDVLEMIEGLCDSFGRLAVIRQASDSRSGLMALAVKHQAIIRHDHERG